MERQNNAKAQQSIKYRLLACVVAVALAIGLSAMPALAEPSEDAGGSISIVSVDTSTDAKAEKADASKGESNASDSSSKAESWDCGRKVGPLIGPGMESACTKMSQKQEPSR